MSDNPLRDYAEDVERQGSEGIHILASAYLASDDAVEMLRARVAELEELLDRFAIAYPKAAKEKP